MEKILDVRDLNIEFQTHAGRFSAINGASFHVNKGEVMAIVGESGSGKSVITQSIVKLIPSPPSFITGGEILFEGRDLIKAGKAEMESIRGKKISVIFQDAMTALNPTMKIGKQITEVIMEHMSFSASQRKELADGLLKKAAESGDRAHVVAEWLTEHFRINRSGNEDFQKEVTGLLAEANAFEKIDTWIAQKGSVTPKRAKETAVELLKMAKIPDPEKRMNQYIFQFSGGMRQRVMIAVAMACRPKLLIADEPTTALDVTIKNDVLDLLIELIHQLGTSVILITHDLGIVASYADRIGVLYAGDFVEMGTSSEIFYNPKHPYTIGLLNAIPRLDSNAKDDLKTIEGTPPNLFKKEAGCAFAARCEYCMAICRQKKPPETKLSESHSTSCFLLDPRAKDVRQKLGVQM